MKFDTKGLRRKDFKTEEDYLSAVYDKNNVTQIPKKVFINRVKAYKELDESSRPTIKRALDKLANTKAFTPYGERAVDNFLKGAKDVDPGFVKALSTAVRDEKGHFTGFKKSELKWDNERRAYIYMGKIMIDVSNSPQQITMIRL